MSEIEYTEGVCDDGAAILADGRMMTIREVLETLNASDKHQVSLSLSQDSAIRLQNSVDVLRDENAKQRALIKTLVKALEDIAGARWNEDGDLDDVCTVADRALEAAKEQSQ